MELQSLKDRLAEIDRIPAHDWYNSLTGRGRAELEFHNKNRDRTRENESRAQDTYEKLYGNRKYYAATARSVAHLWSWIDMMSPGAVVLDYACGDGNIALRAARAGAKLAIGLDISDVSIHNARNKADREGLTANTYFVQSNAEDTKLPDECIDVAICSGMLHHLDLSYALPELRRIMKVGGRILAFEALDYNPAIKLYRMLTPEMRTEWEKAHILGFKDLTFARRFFDVSEVRFWHPTGYIGGKFPPLLPLLDRLDRLLEKVPLVQLMAWSWTFELVRPRKA